MQRRAEKRFARRVQVRFWTEQEPDVRVGYTTNVSVHGMFISTNMPFPPGTKIHVEISDGIETFKSDGRVVHAARVAPLLQKLRPSGMGIHLSESNPLVVAMMGQAQSTGDHPSVSIRYENPADLLEAFQREIQHGELFVRTRHRPRVDSEVVVELRVQAHGERVLHFPARVVRRSDAERLEGQEGAVAGVGVAFLEPSEVFQRLKPFLEAGRRGPLLH